jgi:SSS family solute:Na+ symporter
MNLAPFDLALIGGYLVFVALLGFWVKKRATQKLDAYYLAGRSVPWWMLGLAGCSSYIDIGGTMAMVGALYYLGLKAVWATHIYWGWFMICFYMAFQAKWIRRSGVMTFAEWNETRYGTGRDAEGARIASALFLLLLMIFNLTYIAVGIGKFAEEFLPLPRWLATLIVFAVVGVYVVLAGFFGVILTDMLQTLLIAVGAVILAVMVFTTQAASSLPAAVPREWMSLKIPWRLWPGFLDSAPPAYQHFDFFGLLMVAGFSWMIFRLLAGPNVWDFQFFLTARSSRDAALAGGMWTVGYTLRWILGCAFLFLGIHFLGNQAGFDAERIMPLVLINLPVGVRGLFMAVLLAALMSTLDAMINVTSSVVVNDFLKRYFLKRMSQKQLVRLGQAASVVALTIGFIASLSIENIISAWETMIFVVVTMILVPATLRWHWWRFSARAFYLSMAASTLVILGQKVFFAHWSPARTLGLDILACFLVTLLIGFLTRPPDMDTLVTFYSRIRPFGFWGPVRREAVRKGLVPSGDKMPALDALNGILTAGFQLSLALVPFYALLREWRQAGVWGTAAVFLAVLLYFTWYKNLPAREEG